MADWFIVALTVLTMAGAVVSWWLREGSRKARNEALEARDEARAHREAAEQQAAALQQLAEIAAAEAQKPPWRLAHFKGDTYLLRNDSAQAQYDVAIGLPDFAIVRGEHEWPSIGPGEARQFFAVRTLAAPGVNVVVTWAHRPGGPQEQRWEHPLPARP